MCQEFETDLVSTFPCVQPQFHPFLFFRFFHCCHFDSLDVSPVKFTFSVQWVFDGHLFLRISDVRVKHHNQEHDTDDSADRCKPKREPLGEITLQKLLYDAAVLRYRRGVPGNCALEERQASHWDKLNFTPPSKSGEFYCSPRRLLTNDARYYIIRTLPRNTQMAR